MASEKQRKAARSNVKKAQSAARSKQTLKNLPSKTRTALGKEASAVRRGDEPTRKELEAEARTLTSQTGAAVAAVARVTRSPVTVTTFDRLVVQQLGLGDVATHVQSVARGAGLHPPSYFGSEVVARFLGLRYDHPSGTDKLELFPSDPITRAEAAWSLAQVLGFGDWEVSYARDTLSAFALPTMT